ncbi:MAG: flagellar export chaperone FliS [Proteobacteria bacterium]|nr:flagellar export chaperone FliS [Pseudomonadota bacterium]
MNAYGQKQYRHTQVTTVDKGRLIVLLYDGAIKFLKQARECSLSGDIEGKANNLNRSLDIIAELNQSLNMNDGGDLSKNLRRLYMFWSDHLIQGKIKKDVKFIDDVLEMMKSLNEAWNHAVSQPEAQGLVPKDNGTNTRARVTV